MYAGYRPRPEWLTCVAIYGLAGRRDTRDTTAYRQYLEDYVKQGAPEDLLRQVTAALAIGSTAFIEALRKGLPESAGEQSNLRQWRRLLPFETVKQAVGAVKGEAWEAFVDRHGYTGRDLALHYGRMRGGYTLRSDPQGMIRTR